MGDGHVTLRSFLCRFHCALTAHIFCLAIKTRTLPLLSHVHRGLIGAGLLFCHVVTPNVWLLTQYFDMDLAPMALMFFLGFSQAVACVGLGSSFEFMSLHACLGVHSRSQLLLAAGVKRDLTKINVRHVLIAYMLLHFTAAQLGKPCDRYAGSPDIHHLHARALYSQAKPGVNVSMPCCCFFILPSSNELRYKCPPCCQCER
eukprot:1151204-Pelagomonas_calceolata.AAC.3